MHYIQNIHHFQIFAITAVFENESSSDTPSKRSSATEKVGDRNDTLFVRNPSQAGEYEIAVQWYRPELTSLVRSIDQNSIILLVAMNTKSIAGNSSSVSFSQVASLIHAVYVQQDCKELHDEMVEFIQNSEGDQAIKTGKWTWLNRCLYLCGSKGTKLQVNYSQAPQIHPI